MRIWNAAVAMTLLIVGVAIGAGGFRDRDPASLRERDAAGFAPVGAGIHRDGAYEVNVADLEHVPPCAEVFVEGRVIASEDWPLGCGQPDGTVLVSSIDMCVDGRVLRVNDLGWAYEGEGFQRGGTVEETYAELFDRCLP